MRTIKQLFFLVAIAIYNAICTVTGGASLKKLVPTGVITQGILGGFSGKVGPVVGGKWKDIDYMRGYVIPANPNTTAQQTVRAKFAQMVKNARDLLASLLQPFWDPFNSTMSGFNAWIKENYALADSAGIIDETAIMSKGTLEGASITSATYGSLGGTVDIGWSQTITGNGELTDSVGVVVYDTVNDDLFVFTPSATRDDETVQVVITTSLTFSNVIAYLFFYRGTGPTLTVSDNDGAVCASP